MREMVLHGCHELMKRGVISKRIGILVGYSHDICPAAKGTAKLVSATNVSSLMEPPVLELFGRIVRADTPIRRLAISFDDTVDEGCEGYDFSRTPTRWSVNASVSGRCWSLPRATEERGPARHQLHAGRDAAGAQRDDRRSPGGI